MTNHAHVLVCVAERPDLRLREIADWVGVTERAVHRIISDLESDGYLSSRRVGRRNVYEIRRGARLRHALESAATIGELVALFASERGSSSDVA
jgi:predicted transcriptional regulator